MIAMCYIAWMLGRKSVKILVVLRAVVGWELMQGIVVKQMAHGQVLFLDALGVGMLAIAVVRLVRTVLQTKNVLL
jgi:hypothetical protein